MQSQRHKSTKYQIRALEAKAKRRYKNIRDLYVDILGAIVYIVASNVPVDLGIISRKDKD